MAVVAAVAVDGERLAFVEIDLELFPKTAVAAGGL